MWWKRQLGVATIGRTCSDQRQPGCWRSCDTTSSPMCTSLLEPNGKTSRSSGSSRLLRTMPVTARIVRPNLRQPAGHPLQPDEAVSTLEGQLASRAQKPARSREFLRVRMRVQREREGTIRAQNRAR